MVGEIISELRRFRRQSGATPAGKMTFGVRDNFVERFFAVFSLVLEHVAKFDKLAQVGFFFNDMSVILSASSGKVASIRKRK